MAKRHHNPAQIELFAAITDAYISAGAPISNQELYQQVVARTGEDHFHARVPIGRDGALHDPYARTVRWYQQTLKQLGVIERLEGERGIWQLTKKQGNDLDKAASGVKLVAFSTDLGISIWGSDLDVFPNISDPIALCLTSPPYLLRVARNYGGLRDEGEYVSFIIKSLEPIVKNLLPGASIVLNLGNDSFEQGRPSRSLYLEKLTLALHYDLGLSLMDRIPWVNYSKPPSPTIWSCVNPYQLSSAYEHLLWFTNDPLRVRSNNRNVLQPHTEQHQKLMAEGGAGRRGVYGDGAYRLRESSFSKVTEGRLPRNVITAGHRCADSSAFDKSCRDLGYPTHGAKFPSAIPDFCIRFLTQPNDLVVDLFSGSGKTGLSAERLHRRWLMTEVVLQYVRASSELFRGFPGFSMHPLLC